MKIESLQDQEEAASCAAREAGANLARLRTIRSPLRVCLLGAHIDHQGGQVLGTAIDRYLLLAFEVDSGQGVSLVSANYCGHVRFMVTDPPLRTSPAWGGYAAGAVMALGRKYRLQRGIRGGVAGMLPVGGLSSSAAVGVAYLLALEHANGLQVSVRENIELDRVIENEYMGVNNGILDQSMILLSREGALTAVDCLTGEYTHLPASPNLPDFRIAIVHSGIYRALVSTRYNRRVAECREAARLLLEAARLPVPETPLLRHVPPEVFAKYGHLLPKTLGRRARHFFTEQERVARGCAAWAAGDLATLGALIAASGESSIVNYECGTPALVDLVRILNGVPGVYGSRFSGGGFRGTCFALVAPDAGPAIAEALRREFDVRHPDLAGRWRLDICRPGMGALLL